MKEFNEIKKEMRTLIGDAKKAKMILDGVVRNQLNDIRFNDSYVVYLELEHQGECWTEFHENMSLSDMETVYGNISADIHVMKVIGYHQHNVSEIVDLKYKYELDKAKEFYREAYIKLLNNSRYGKEQSKITKGDLPF